VDGWGGVGFISHVGLGSWSGCALQPEFHQQRAAAPPPSTHHPSIHPSIHPGKYFPSLGSILPVGDITAAIPTEMADVAVLEEPEHVSVCVCH